MFPSSTLLATVLLALSVAGTPLQPAGHPTLSFAKRFNTTGLLRLVENDVARARALRAHAESRIAARKEGNEKRAVVSFPVTNEVVSYIASVGVGSPASTFDLIIDTGSSNTWVGATKKFTSTSTTKTTTNRVAVSYGSGDFSGNEFVDQVTLAPGLVIRQQVLIGVATSSDGFDGVDGILGIGPVDLTEDTLSPSTRSTIPTVTDSLFSQGTITSNEVGVIFNPTTVEETANGELTFGGIDTAKLTSAVSFTPLTTTSPASEFWGINQSVKMGSTTLLATTAGIVDTGTTLTLLATNAFTAYQRATGAVLDRTTGLLRLTPAQFANLQPLTFTTSGGSFTLTANGQAWPRALNTAIGGTSQFVYLVVNDLGTPSGEGLDFINGQTFLERFASVFDTAGRRVGFATTPNTNSNVN